MEIPPEVRGDLVKLQQIQQQLQNLMFQKQNIQVQKIEVENALKEIENLKAKEDVYEIVGNVMLKKAPESLKSSLKDKSELFNLRINSLDKQINKLTEEAKEIQGKVSAELNKKR